MKHIYKLIIVALVFGLAPLSHMYGQCTTAGLGQYPGGTITPGCYGGPPVMIVSCAFTDEMSVLQLQGGVTYTFTSTEPTDFFTITDDATNTPITSGVGPLVFVCPSTGLYDLYRHFSAACDDDGFVCRDIFVECGTPPPLPTNDTCSTAIFLNCGDVVTGSTTTANPDVVPACGFGGGNGLWYTFTGSGLPTTLSLCGSEFDTYLHIYSGACDSLVCEEFNDDDGSGDCGLSSVIEDFPTTFGTTYYVLVNGFNAFEMGNFTLSISSSVSNDDCSSAVVIPLPGTYNGTTGCAGVDAVSACGTASAPTTGGVWYSYTTGCSANITASLCVGTTFNSQISVFDGTCGALNCIGGNNDFCLTQSEVTWPGVAGTTYYILVHGAAGEEGNFILDLSQADTTAPVPDIAVLPTVSGSCSVTVPTPTATDNCVGSVNGTTLDPTTYTVGGSYVVNWTYDDGNGNTATQTQNVNVAADVTPPTIVCLNDTTLSSAFDACGVTVNYSIPVADDNCSTIYPGTDAYYIRSQFGFGEPWGSNNNITAMDAVFGAGVWFSEFFETCSPAAVFSSATKFVFLEGSDAHANELNAFLAANLPAIETYVYNGGTIFINAAPNEGGDINVGFGGTTINYPSICGGPVDGVNPSDPVFAGPFLPCTNAGYSGGSFSHADVTGSGLTNVLEGCGVSVYSTKTWGAGLASFGGMTMPQFHSPSPDAQNLRQNIISQIANTITSENPPTITQTAGLPPGSLFPVGTTTNTFVATDNSGNSDSCSFDVIVIDDVPPATTGGALILNIYYGAFALDESTWELYDSTNTLIASGGPYGFESPGVLAEQIDISGALEPLTFIGQTQGFWNDNVLDFEVTCGGTTIASGTIDAGEPATSFTGIQGCAVVLPTISEECSATLGSPAPTLEDNCDGTITGITTDSLVYDSNGTYIVTWTFTDLTGNSSVLQQTVIINDAIAPVADVSPLPLLTDTCSVTISPPPTATDNCSGTITGTTTDPLTYDAAGTYTVTWTYDDGRGNTSTQTQTVTVTDTEPPVPTLPILPNVEGNCVVTIPSPPTASDNCSGELIIGTTIDPISYNLIGTFLVIWHFDDGNGNTWTQNQIVVVNPCLGLEDPSGASSVLIYPNPGSGIFTVSLSELPVENTEIRLVDALGQVLYSGILTGEVTQFDFSHLAAATYYVLITNNTGHVSKPVIIKKDY